jgi:hypothetical protein
MTFEGLHDLEPILDYYNGGWAGTNDFAIHGPFQTDKTDAQGKNIHDYNPVHGSPSENYGITFSDNALAVLSGPNGIGDFGNDPSAGNTVALFAPFNDQNNNPGVTMTIWNGWQGGTFSFWYATYLSAGLTVTAYDAPGGQGNIIAQGTLPDPPDGSDGSNYEWNQFSLDLPADKTAYSIYFSAALGADGLALSGLGFPAGDTGPTNPPSAVPEGTSAGMWLSLLAVGAIFNFKRRRSG